MLAQQAGQPDLLHEHGVANPRPGARHNLLQLDAWSELDDRLGSGRHNGGRHLRLAVECGR